MLQRWFRRRAADVSAGRLGEGKAVYAIGDIRGRLDLLDQTLPLIAEDAQRHPKDVARSLVFVGDYIDRGPESRGVIERLLDDPLPGFATVCLMGNHEDALLGFLDRDGLGWLTYGGLETLMSYGVPVRALPADPVSAEALRQATKAALPAGHEAFLRQCSFHHVEDDYVFVHAGIKPGRALDRQSPQDLLWIRDEFLRSLAPLPGKVIVHGHTICDDPQDLGHRINIDTGAFKSGRLTTLVLRGSARRFLCTASEGVRASELSLIDHDRCHATQARSKLAAATP